MVSFYQLTHGAVGMPSEPSPLLTQVPLFPSTSLHLEEPPIPLTEMGLFLLPLSNNWQESLTVFLPTPSTQYTPHRIEGKFHTDNGDGAEGCDQRQWSVGIGSENS